MTPIATGGAPVPGRLRAGIFSLIALSIVCMPSAGLAQSSAPEAAIGGVVRDASGAVVPGAEVEARAAGSVAATAAAGLDGRYRVVVPRSGVYELRVRHDGFAEQVLAVRVSGETTRNVTLQVGGVADAVVVTASRGAETRAQTTGAISVLTRNDAEALGSVSLADLVRSLPGMSVASNGREGALTSLFSRGGESDYNLVLIDGVRMNQNGGGFDFARVGAGEIERVEVVRGAQSALYGSDAMGAVVQVFTVPAVSRAPLHASGSIEAGTFNAWRGTGAIIGRAGALVDYHAGISGRRTDGAFADALVEDDTFNDLVLNAAAGLVMGPRARLRTSVRAASAEGRLVGPIAYGPGDTGTTYNTRDLSWSLNVSHLLGESVTGSASLAYFRSRALSEDAVADAPFDLHALLSGAPARIFPASPRLVRLIDRAEFDAIRSGEAPLPPDTFLAFAPFGIGDFPFTSLTRVQRPGFRYQADLHWIGGRLTGGYEYERETSPLEDAYEVRNHAAFVQQQFSAGDRWFATVGARLDDESGFGSFVSPKLSFGGYLLPVRDSAVSSLKIFVNAGTGIKRPQFSELFGGAGFDGNPDLEPERARSFDVGAEVTLARQRVRASAIYFANRFRDAVEFRATGFTEDGLPDFLNVAGAEADGWEFEGVLQRSLARFTARGSYTHLDSRVTETTRTGAQFQPGQPLLRRPAHAGALRVSYAAGRVTVHGDAEFRGESHDSSFLFLEAVPSGVSTDITVLPGYAAAGFTVDVRAHGRATLFLRGNNITDTAYETSLGFPGLPRSFVVGVRLTSAPGS